MRLPRMTTRRWMIVVAILCASLAASLFRNRKMIGFWEAMKKEYSYAADHPWPAVAPDPPNP